MTILNDLKSGIHTASAEETEALGAKIVEALPQNSVLALSGDLGAGKTTLTRGIARGLGILASVTSPTYNIYTIYKGSRQLIHMDAFRLSDEHEVESLAIDELLKEPFLIVVEWPENIPGFFEDYETLRLKMQLMEDHRHEIRLV